MFGLLNVDKPAAWTSRDVVNRVQRMARPHKVGHAGTLDPLATGVLIVAIGPATRLVEYVQRMPKTYRATFLLGRTSDTDDTDGDMVEIPGAPIPSREQVQAAIPKFLGTIEQQPPAYSALKIAGQPAYKLARRGAKVDLTPRPVEIHSIELVSFEYPKLELLIRCGGGTYVRSLGRDLAESLGTGAVMSALNRLAIGSFKVEESVACEKLTPSEIEARLLSPLLALGEMQRLTLDDDQVERVARGQAIASHAEISSGEITAVDARGRLVAILKPIGAAMLAPTKCFVQS